MKENKILFLNSSKYRYYVGSMDTGSTKDNEECTVFIYNLCLALKSFF